MGVESPFETLRIDPDADADEIEQAYRRRVMEAHPDHGGSASEFQKVRAAYEAVTSGNGTPELAAGDADGDPGDRSRRRADPDSEPEADPEPDPEPHYTVERLDELATPPWRA